MDVPVGMDVYSNELGSFASIVGFVVSLKLIINPGFTQIFLTNNARWFVMVAVGEGWLSTSS